MIAGVSIPYWLGSKLRGRVNNSARFRRSRVSIPYWLGSKLRGRKT